jgi:hypothetical protein
VAAACTCPEPALCARLGRHANRRLHLIWLGANPTMSQEQQRAIRVR